MTEKIRKDGSKSRWTKYNRICFVAGGILLLTGVLLLVIKGMFGDCIDAEGILHEPFFLLPVGFLCIFCGFLSFGAVGIRAMICKVKSMK